MAFIDNEEDHAVEETPVFFSENFQDNLFIFQYPTKTQILNLDNVDIMNTFVKPVNEEVKIDFALDIESHYYDQFKGEKFAAASDGKTQIKGERPTYKRGIMDKQTYLSTRSINNVNNYIVGVIIDREVHLSTLKSILQLRPSFSHFDKEDKRTKTEQKVSNDDEDDDEIQQVTVKFTKIGASNKKVKEKQGYDNFIKNKSEEPWCETFWHHRKSHIAEMERQKLFSTNRHNVVSEVMKPGKYLNKLLPNISHEDIHTILPTQVITKDRLRKLGLVEQLKTILKDAKMLAFDDIVRLINENSDVKVEGEKILRTLPQVGILIHGNWVPQSEILYPAESVSNTNGVSSELMIRARDYILFRFSRTKHLNRRQVISATQIPAEETLEVLQSVSFLNTDKKWQLLLQPDGIFESRYSELVQRQEMVWRATEQTYNEMDFEKSPKRVRKRSIRESKSQTPTTSNS